MSTREIITLQRRGAVLRALRQYHDNRGCSRTVSKGQDTHHSFLLPTHSRERGQFVAGIFENAVCRVSECGGPDKSLPTHLARIPSTNPSSPCNASHHLVGDSIRPHQTQKPHSPIISLVHLLFLHIGPAWFFGAAFDEGAHSRIIWEDETWQIGGSCCCRNLDTASGRGR